MELKLDYAAIGARIRAFRYKRGMTSERLAELADLTGITKPGMSDAEKARVFIEKIKEMNRTMNIPDKFDCIKEEDIPTLVKRALKEGNPLYPVPKLMDAADCESVIRRMMS